MARICCVIVFVLGQVQHTGMKTDIKVPEERENNKNYKYRDHYREKAMTLSVIEKM